MCASLRETRREYGHVASSSTSLSPTVSRRDTHILPPPQARRPASGAEASTHPLGLASWKGHARGGTVGDRMSTTSPQGWVHGVSRLGHGLSPAPLTKQRSPKIGRAHV